MRTTIRRDRIVDLVIGNRRSFAIHFDFVMIADHAALRATVHEVTAGAFAVVSVELEVKLHVPPIVANPRNMLLARAHAHTGIRIPRRLSLPFPECQGP
jgi:hypothetical protein